MCRKACFFYLKVHNSIPNREKQVSKDKNFPVVYRKMAGIAPRLSLSFPFGGIEGDMCYRLLAN